MEREDEEKNIVITVQLLLQLLLLSVGEIAIKEIDKSSLQIQRILYIYHTNEFSNKQESVNISLLLVLYCRRYHSAEF